MYLEDIRYDKIKTEDLARQTIIQKTMGLQNGQGYQVKGIIGKAELLRVAGIILNSLRDVPRAFEYELNVDTSARTINVGRLA